MQPTLRSGLLLAAGIPLAALPALLGARSWVAWAVFLALCLLAIGVDAILLASARRLRLEATAPAMLYIGHDEELRVAIRLDGRSSPDVVEAELEQDPLLVTRQGLRATLVDGAGELVVPLRALRRGTVRVGGLWLRWSGPLGLMSRSVRRDLAVELAVIPDVRSVRRAALQFFGSREFLSGQKVDLMTGDGSEFERLREFVPGLDHRAIDWKASARHRKLLSREFRAERNHQVVIAYDTGHLMSEPVDGIPKLDHAINAGLLLTLFSLHAGDRVGLLGFDRGVNVYCEPQGGMSAFARLQLASAGLAYSAEETNFTLGLAELSLRLRRRSLIVLLTDFVDTVTAQLMVENLQRLSRRHLVVFVALRNPELGVVAAGRPGTVRDMARSVVASGFLRERQAVFQGLVRSGIQVLDAGPGQITPELLNRYLDIKRREQIA